MEGFGGAPRFLAYPRAFTVQSGSDAVLSCQITGDPQPSILWEKDKTPIEPSGRFHVEAKGDLYSLLVSCATPQDSGLYICKAKNSVGETYAAATLKVEAGEPLQEDGCSGGEVPTFLVAPSSTRVCRGEDVMFTCRVSGQPCPVLEWEKDGRKLSDLFESSHFAVGKELEDWHFLKLFGTRPPDGGVYVCRARSGSREALAAAVLLVEPRAPPEGLPNGSPADGPQLLAERQQRQRQHVARRHTGPDTRVPNGTVSAGVLGAKAFTVSAGKHAKFRCYVTGKPKPEIIWQKDGEPLVPGRRHLVYEDREGYFILKVLYCKPQDQGLYICTASNTAGRTLSAVQLQVKEHRLRFQVQLMDVEVAEREDAVLECQVPLETIPTAWYLEDRELQPSHKYVMEERGVVRRLTIRDARTDDDGIYLCQMKDKGRSIAEVSVRGVITKRLPRKLDVMEGENAVFCVETREALEGICWSRDGLQLRESPRTVLKSFGRTHLLVLVHVTRQDAGIISFAVGESQTSSQLRVKSEMSLAESNAALLTWCPAPDAHLRPPGRYLLERREVAGGEWVQCLATDLPGRVRVLGDSVPREADYCFRVCAANEHGRSSPVEFPGSVHLARLERGLQDVRVRDGEDARFSLELSAAVQGTWFLNGTRLGEEEEEEGDAAGGRCSVQRRRTEHSLLIRGARLAESGAQVTFVSGSVRDSATLHVQAPQVRITPVPEAERLREVSTGLPVLLECQVSPPDAPVRWLKDGEAVPLDDVIAVQAEGCVRRLLLRSAGPSDTGVYTCDARDDAVSFVVTVTEAPVRIVGSNEEAPHAYMAGQRVELWCQLSRPEALVRWYKDGEEVEESENLVLEQEGPRCRLVLPCARPQDAGEFVCDAGGDSIFYTITVAEAPVRIVGSNEEAPHAYTAGQRVELWCQLSHPEAPVHWYKDGEEVEESENLVLEQEGPWCRLVLPCARLQDAGEFVCDAGGDSVFYTVTVADTPVHWLKDGEAVVPTKVLAICSEGCSRRLHIPAAAPSDSGTYTCDAGDNATSFRVTVNGELLGGCPSSCRAHPPPRLRPATCPLPEAPVRIVSSNKEAPHAYVAGQRVELWCQLSHLVAPVRWYKDGKEVEESENLVLEQEGTRCRLVLPCAQLQDTGEFICDAKDASLSFHILVAEPPVRILHPPQRSLELPVQAPGRVELRCQVSVPDAPVRWFKDGLEVDETDNLLLLEEGAWRCLLIPRSSAEDTGEYICESKDEAVSFDVKVSELPVRILQPLRPPPVVTVFLGETVTLGCELSRADASVCWAKEGIRLEAGGSLVLEEEGAHRRLLIPAAQAEHSGKYICDAADDTVTFTVQVLDPLVRILERDVLPTHRHCQAMEDLVLEVHLSHTHGEVKWYKDGEKLQDTGHVRLEEDGARRSLVVLGTTVRDAGEYLCDTGDDSIIFFVTVEVPRVVEIITELQNLTVLEGEDATFKCLVSPEDVAVTWQLNGQPVVPSERLLVTRSGLCHNLTLRQCQPGDAGTVMANVEGLVTTARLSVQEAQVLFVRKLRDVVVAEEQGDACLEVEVSHEAAEVQWLKQGVLLQPGSKYQLEESGCRRTLTIRCLGPADHGTYRCESLHDRTQAKLCVEPRKVSIRTPLVDVETFEKETATFHLELSHPGVPGVWTRDGIRVKPSGTCRISATGCGHSLTLERLALEDSGTVTFTADTLRCSARLLVQEPPVTMVRVPRDLGVLETGVASFECELSRPSAEVKWFKDGQELRPGPHCRIYSAGRRRILQLSHCELADAGTYTCDAGDCRASATLHVQERQVHIVQDLQDAQVREGDNAIFTCEASHGDVRGEWFRDREKIKVSSTVKIRQEGTRHFLLFCGVRPEDAGLIRFSAGTATSEASLQVEALPIRIVKPLRDKTVLARHKATLECTVSHARGRVRWLRGDTEIFAGDKYEICNLDCYRTLIIHRVGPEDEDSYTCDAFDDRSTARLLVEGS
ncbi:obscurin-like protein 1 [Numenius arquata]|uniref:obscurin-like protein 1 n=1 Tax=Numenius arquata TaxID=31919 RepID=UPI003D306AC0